MEPEAYIREGAFAGIEDFGSLSRLSFLGDATNKSAESILVWIRREMQKIYREEAETKKENRQDEKKEIEKEAKTAMQEGEKENEIDLSPGRGLLNLKITYTYSLLIHCLQIPRRNQTIQKRSFCI